MMNESNKGPHIYSFLLDNDISLFFWYSQLEGPSLLDLDMYIIHRKFWHLFFGAVGNYRVLLATIDFLSMQWTSTFNLSIRYWLGAPIICHKLIMVDHIYYYAFFISTSDMFEIFL